MNYVIDTHILIWYFICSKRLPEKAKIIIDDCINGRGFLLISTISLSEALDLSEKRKIDFDFRSMFRLIQNESVFQIVDYLLPVFNETMRLKKIKEIHDRIIAATAKLFNAAILTKDKIIISSGEIKYYS
jgi:PIN domain nuclease of toxin-antitoxin system